MIRLYLLLPFLLLLKNTQSQTILQAGDIAIVGVNSNIGNDDISTYCEVGPGTGRDRISFVCFKDLEPGTTIDLTDNGWERAFAGQWGNSEGFLQMTRTGGTILAGTTITIELPRTISAQQPLGILPDNDWLFQQLGTRYVNMGSGGDQLYIMQDGVWNNGTGCPAACANNATYTGGRILYAYSSNGWITTPPGSANNVRFSRLHPSVASCYSVTIPSNFASYQSPTTATSRATWISRIRTATNWTGYASCNTYQEPPPQFPINGPSVWIQCINNCSGCAPLTATLKVNINMPASWGPFSVTYSNGAVSTTLNNAVNGQTFSATLNSTTVYSIVSFNAPNGCPMIFDYGLDTVTVFPGVQSTVAVVNPSCNGGNNGSIAVHTTSGGGPFSFNIGGGAQTDSVFTGLTAGSYAVTITNAGGCTAVKNAVLTQPPLLNMSGTQTPANCGNNTGTINLSTNGGTPGYTFDWADLPGTTNPQNRTNLAGGSYDVTVTDTKGCTTNSSFTIVSTSIPVLNCSELTPVSLPGGTNGVGIVDISGSTAFPMQVHWSGPSTGTSTASSSPFNINNLSAGTYAITVTSAENCTATCSFIITTQACTTTDTTYINGTTCDPALAGMTQNLLTGSTGCDSLVITTITLLPSVTTNLTATTCNPALVGVSQNLLTAVNGCDSLVITTTTLSPGDTTYLTATTCNPALVGISQNLLTTVNGCDSLVITTTTLSPGDTTYLTATTCNPALVGISQNLLTTVNGCDSLVITTTTLSPGDTTYLTATTCNPALVGISQNLLTAVNGCDSLVITTTTLSPGDTTYLTATTCNPALVGISQNLLTTVNGCDSLVITTTTLSPGDTTYLTATTCNPALVGISQNLLTTVNGCDSLVITTTTLSPGDTTYLTATTCNPALVGISQNLLTTVNGCDSLVITTTTLSPGDTTYLTATTCNPALVGISQNLLTTVNGCDSLVITTTTLSPEDTTYLTATTCNPALVGISQNLLTTVNGCDSLVITTTTLSPGDTTYLTATTCNPALVGISQNLLTTVNGCDSLVITTTTLSPGDTTYLTATTCNPALVGISQNLLTTVNGCDSLVITTTTLSPGDTTYLTATTCNPALVGISQNLLTTVNGCDSLVITTTTLSPGDTTYLTATTCNPALVGISQNLLTTVNGCDSLVITTTTLSPSDTLFVNKTTCDPALAGVSIQVFSNTNGCDSTVITTTTLSFPVTVQLTATTCNPALAGITQQVFTGVNGCDSTVVITTTLLASDTTYQQLTSCDPDQAGVSVNLFSNINGCDSLVITSTLYQPLYISYTAVSPLCFGEKGSITIDSIPGGKAPFAFSNDGVTFSAGTLPYQTLQVTPGPHQIFVEDGNGCLSDTSLVLAAPNELTLNLGTDQTIVQGDSVLLEPQVNFTPKFWLWATTDSLLCDTCGAQFAGPMQTTLYQLTAKDSNGCAVVASIRINVTREKQIYVPNVFVPGGADNNALTIHWSGSVQSVSRFEVFDRWGELVYQAIQPANGATLWDGIWKGKSADEGVYIYWMEIIYQDQQTERLTGDITILR